MGGRSSQASRSDQVDKRIVADGGSTVVSLDGDGPITNNVTMSDFGAIASSLATVRELGLQALLGSAAAVQGAQANTKDIADFAFDLVRDSSSEVLTVAKGSTAAIADAYKLASDQVAGNRTLAITGLIIAGVVAAMAFSRR